MSFQRLAGFIDSGVAIVFKGRIRVTIFEAEKRMATADLAPGDCAYLPHAMGHMVQNIGTETCRFIGVHDAPIYVECCLSQWLSTVPAHLVAADLGLTEAEVASLPRKPMVFTRG